MALMARQELPREDLLRDARALVMRGEYLPATGEPPIVTGFRANGAASFFFGEDPAYHFTSNRKLRRAYAGGELYKAQAGQLIRLQRERTTDQVVLRSAPLAPRVHDEFLLAARQKLSWLEQILGADSTICRGETTHDGLPLRPRLLAWLAQLPFALAVADGPQVA
ncbi:MAG: hypothetical protein SFX18_19235 [Pirellulales bacterium]|nr:hypothetical protein [Pirellulales bacterium]